MKKPVLIFLFLSIIAIFLPSTLQMSHAASTVGRICLADPSYPPIDPCPSGQGPMFNGPLTSPSHQIRVGVFVSGSDALNAFEIILLTNHTVLKPAGSSLAGSVITGQTFQIVNCVGGVNLTVAKCADNDSADTLHIVASQIGGTTASPITGLLFTAIFNITSPSSSPVQIDFQTGCKLTSVTGTTRCVTIVNGGQIVPENPQAATFNNSDHSLPFVSIAANSTSVVSPFTGTRNILLTLTGQNAWPGFNRCTCLVTLSHIEKKGLTVSLNTTNVDMTIPRPRFILLSLTSSLAGDYSVTVFAQYSTFDVTRGFNDTLVAPITIEAIFGRDFSLALLPPSVTVDPGKSQHLIVRVTGVNGFTDNVRVSLSTPDRVTASIMGKDTVQGGGDVVLNVVGGKSGDYSVIITGTTGSQVRTAVLAVHVREPGSPSPSQPGNTGGYPVYLLVALGVVTVVGGVFLAGRKRLGTWVRSRSLRSLRVMSCIFLCVGRYMYLRQ